MCVCRYSMYKRRCVCMCVCVYVYVCACLAPLFETWYNFMWSRLVRTTIKTGARQGKACKVRHKAMHGQDEKTIQGHARQDSIRKGQTRQDGTREGECHCASSYFVFS